MNLGLLLTLITGIFILVGSLIGHFTKNNNKLIDLSISMAFSVMVCLSIFELFPSALEHITSSSSKSYIILIIFILIGIFILKLLDHFVPNHDKDHDDESLYHIGIVASIAILLHNIIEGMTIYESTMADSKMGLLVTLGVGLHNIPMGLVIYSTLSKSNHTKKNKIFFLGLIFISTLIGGLIMFMLGSINSLLVGILLSITLGMIIYITLFELLGEMLETENKKIVFLGLAIGLIIFLISLTFE